MRADPGVTGVTSSGRRVAGFRMCRCPVSEPVMMLAEFGENRMLVDAYWDDMREKTRAWGAMKMWCEAMEKRMIRKVRVEGRW